MSPCSLALNHLPVASSQLLAQRELLERVDRKYVTDSLTLEKFISSLNAEYHVVHGSDGAWTRYETHYFDTPSLQTFNEHVRGRRPRYKMRLRHHLERKRTWFEVKCKKAGGKIEKHRLDLQYGQTELTDVELDFAWRHIPFDRQALLPSVLTQFDRATLLGARLNERITIDRRLHFERNGRGIEVHQDLAIIELKQPQYFHSTIAVSSLRELAIREQSISKYCAGVSLLHERARPRYGELMLKRLSRIAEWKTVETLPCSAPVAGNPSNR